MFYEDHFADMFIASALFFFWYFTVGVFGTQKLINVKRWSVIVSIFGIAYVTFLFFAPLDPTSGIDVIIFLILTIYCLLVCIPVITQSKRSQRQLEDPVFRAAFASTRYMAYCYTLCLFMFIFDQLVIAVSNWEFSPFYYAGWIFGAMAAVFAYLGFVLPQWFKNLMSYTKKEALAKSDTDEMKPSE